MKRTTQSLMFLCLLLCFTVNANALVISTSAFGNGDGTFQDNTGYGYTFLIDDGDGVVPNTYAAMLLNTSPAESTSLINRIMFNLSADLTYNSDFWISDISPNWVFSAATGGIQFDFIGAANRPDDRLAAGEALTFIVTFDDDVENSLALWTDAPSSLGRGAGGGTDLGQVAVKFQQLGQNGRYSDLLASNWDRNPAPVPEPATMLLFGAGLMGIAGISRRKIKS